MNNEEDWFLHLILECAEVSSYNLVALLHLFQTQRETVNLTPQLQLSTFFSDHM